MTDPLYRGIGVALVTIFDEDLNLDAKQTADLAARLVDVGVDAIVIAGSTGEAAALEPGERGAMVREVKAVIPAAVPVIAGVGSASTRQALGFTDEVLDAGADGLIAISLPGNADQQAYYEAIATRAHGTPLLAYHFPGVSAPGIAFEALASLPVAGLKDSSGDPNRLLLEHQSFDGALYTGAAALVALAGPLGCAGAILALANSHPEECIAAWSGDGAAQAALTDPNRRAQASFPNGIKRMTAERFGTPTFRRMG